ncbi:hypothetical protein CTAYLR_010775 [Chrysophaeum taylorii]|uniref:Sodium bile acid cotransporter n=1 Tax=Chrysophaeum taylorii TaxID=2483200 RepID=A0AAD7U5I6_9STRA|nr:hypothetical protein CTAYLR_010775 [Chrysophaeum taylorii]
MASSKDEEVGVAARFCSKAIATYDANSFLVNVVVVIGLAYAAPGVGLALAPSISASRVAVGIIFLMTGLSLRTGELAKAFANVKFNAFVQIFNLGLMPVVTRGIGQGLRAARALDRDLAIGVFICGALPMTVNMVIVLTKSANGDEAAAVFNSALGNCLGIVVTPFWVLVMLGRTASFSFAEFASRIAQRVLGPLLVGQLLQFYAPSVKAAAKRYRKYLKKLQETCLVFIVYCAFCAVARERRRSDGTARQGPAKIIVMLVVQGGILFASMALAWVLLGALFPDAPRLRVMGLFGCTHKTVAMGIPLIDAIFSDVQQSRVGIFLLPLLIYHPAELVVGSALSSRLAAWVEAQEAHGGGGGGKENPVPLQTEAEGDEEAQAESVELVVLGEDAKEGSHGTTSGP